jgi:tetratricopeptide (TPR) repeat protein
MVANTSESYLKDPRYRKVLHLFQRGQWKTGLKELDELVEKNPLDPTLRALRQEMVLRAKVDLDEAEDQKNRKQLRLKRWGIWLSILIVTLVVGGWGIRTYSATIQQQLGLARQSFEQEVQEIELAVQFRNGHDLMEADRYAEAISLFEEIAGVAPDYPGLSEAIEEARALHALDDRYKEAQTLADSGDLEQALAIYEDIARSQSNYKDVKVRITDIQRRMLLDDMIETALVAMNTGEWVEAVEGFEDVYALDPQYRSDEVQNYLYQSYLNAADEVLSGQADSIAALEIADGYFQRALALRPQDPEVLALRAKARQSVEQRVVGSLVDAAQEVLSEEGDSLEALRTAESYLQQALGLRPDDPEIKLQLQLAQLYQKAQADFNKGLWSQVISDLEFVYTNDMEYALGTARQTLYEAYAARGDSEMASGEYEAALSDYQRAAVLAEQAPSSVLRLVESQVKAANAHGILGNYENAVLLYRSAADLGDLDSRAQEDNLALAATLAEAESFAEAENYRQAYRRYREAFRSADETYDTILHVVESGEYLTMLASRYGSTVQAIVLANEIENPNRIYTNQELVIPVFN